MPYRAAPPTPAAPPAPFYLAGRILEALVSFGLFALAMSWVWEVGWMMLGLSAMVHGAPRVR